MVHFYNLFKELEENLAMHNYVNSEICTVLA